MKEISKNEIAEAVKSLCMEAATKLGTDMKDALKSALKEEKSPLGKDVLGQIVENFTIAETENVPMCQDTGIGVFFVEVGCDVSLDCALNDAINEGVRRGYEAGLLRKSVCEPFTRTNTKDNTPSVVHTTIVEGDKLKIKMAAKGGGSENMSTLKMLKPSDGIEGIKDFIIESVKIAGGNPCPPIVLGVGIGGDFEYSAVLAKKAVFRDVGSPNPDPELDALEKELLEKVNELGIGPMGYGGIKTALGVHILKVPCHIASLPVAINIQCHAGRHKEVTL